MANLQQLTSLEQRDREAVSITLSADELGEGRRSGGAPSVGILLTIFCRKSSQQR